MPALVAGVDSSTQGTKVVVVEAGTGAVVAEGRAPHLVTGTGGARESDPRGWWAALGEALAATGCAARIDAISVAAQQHGLVALDGEGEPLHPAILWNDTRSAPDARGLVEALGGPGAWATRLGSVPTASFTVTSWAWLRRTRPGGGRPGPGDPAPPRLPHRAPHRAGGHRPGRRLGHGVVVARRGPLRRRRARPAADRPRAARCCRRCGSPAIPPGR